MEGRFPEGLVLPSLLGGCVLTGAERKTPDELVRELHEVVKPKLYAGVPTYAYVERNPYIWSTFVEYKKT